MSAGDVHAWITSEEKRPKAFCGYEPKEKKTKHEDGSITVEYVFPKPTRIPCKKCLSVLAKDAEESRK